MPTPVNDTPSCCLVAHAMNSKPGNKPIYAWHAPNHCDPSLPDGKDTGIVDKYEEKARHQQQQQQQQQYQQQEQQPSFYDQEALQEKLRGLEVERCSLSEREDELRERLQKAQVTLSSMRTKKRQLSTAKLLAQVNEGGGNSCSSDKQRPSLSRGGIHYGPPEEHRKDGRVQRQDDNNFAAKDRIMDIELLNDQLRQGQVSAEKEARSHETAARATKAELERMQERLQAMPKRFTESLQLLRSDVDALEREKLSLELAKQQKSFEEADLLASMQRRQTYLRAELNSVLDELKDVKDDRDKWQRRLRVESTLAESLQSQRDRALGELRERFGEDAVERVAFAGAACRDEGERKGWSKEGRSGGHSDSDRSVSVSRIAKALAPVYGTDGVLLTDAAVAEATRECEIGLMDSQQQPARVGFEGFCAIAQRLRREYVV